MRAEDLRASGSYWQLGVISVVISSRRSTSPEIDRQIERNGYALVKGHSVSQPHLHRGDSKP
jgi:hypothetical protein